MATTRYEVVTDLPDEVRTARFMDLADSQVRVRVQVRGDEVVVVAHGHNTAACEALLRRLGATRLGVDLCG